LATYLDFDGFKALSIAPSAFVDEVEKVAPGWVDGQLEYWARWIDSRLRKRYGAPFAAFNDTPPTPSSIQGWLARIVTLRVFLKRGIDPDDVQIETIKDDSTNAQAEILEAANSRGMVRSTASIGSGWKRNLARKP